MKRYEKYGMTHLTAFADQVMRCERKLNGRMHSLLATAYDRRTFLRRVYITWMLKQQVAEGVSPEALYVYKIAKELTPDPEVDAGRSVSELLEFEKDMLQAVDSVLPLFGKDPENDWFVKFHLSGLSWGFTELISQIAVSELLSDKTIGIVDPTKWRKHWRGGMR